MISLHRMLALGIAVVSGLGLTAELAAAALPPAIVAHMSLSYEANIPTWFSSSLLLACAFVAGTIARRAMEWRRHWWGVTVLFGYASLDEATEIHEHLGGLMGTRDVLYFDWILFAIPILLALSAIYLRFVSALPAAVRNGLIVAGALYIGGAVAMEIPLGWWTERFGSDGFGYALIDWVEETLEMIGATAALVVLLRQRADAEEM